MAREVLVVEDEPDIRRLVVLHLERDGFRCRTAANGLDALREAKAAVPDLVVLDLMLPGIDGLEVCRRLRSDASTAGVPIIMLTAKSDEVDRVVGLEVGADDYVASLLAQGAGRARTRRPPALAPGPPAPGARRGARHAGPGAPPGDARRSGAPAHAQGVRPSAGAPRGGRARAVPRIPPEPRVGLCTRRRDRVAHVDVHVRRLRAKLGDAGSRIATIKSVGYRFEVDPA